jgi:hypothetical protein
MAMTTTALARLSGLSLLVGSALVFIGAAGTAVYTGDRAQYVTEPAYIAFNVVMALGTPLVLLGLPGVYASRAAGYGRSGLVGTALLTVGVLVFNVFFGLLSAVMLPYLATRAPSLITGQWPPGIVALLIVGVVAWTAGNLLLGVPLLRGNVRPAWPGYLLVGGAVMEIVQFAVGNSNVVTSLVSALSGLLPFLALGGLGFQLWRPAGHSSNNAEVSGLSL